MIPSDAALTSFTAASQEPTPTTGGSTLLTGRIDVAGIALDYDTIASWLTRLERVRGWVNPWVTSIARPRDGTDHLHVGRRPHRRRRDGAGTAGGRERPMQGRRAVIVAGAGAAVLALLLVFFLVLPKMAEVTEAEEELEDTTCATGTSSSGELNALQQARDEAPENEATIRQVEGLVPPTAELSAVILLLRNAATVAGVQVVSLHAGDPGRIDDRRSSRRISVSASGEGSYFAMVKYLHEIETLPRAAKVEAVSLTPDRGLGDSRSRRRSRCTRATSARGRARSPARPRTS